MNIRELAIAELKALSRKKRGRDLQELLEALDDDPRVGARAIAKSVRNRAAWEKGEKARLHTMLRLERELAKEGYLLIAGADEAGRGALAGPLVAAAVILSGTDRMAGVNDSKKLAPAARRRLDGRIKQKALAWAIGEASSEEIDKLGLQAANLAALSRAVAGLQPPPDFALTDGFKVDCDRIPNRAVVKGDNVSLSIAAASIVAKVYRDDLMADHHQEFSCYGFDENKGYGTEDHLRAILREGPCPIHRRTFYPMSEIGLQAVLAFGE